MVEDEHIEQALDEALRETFPASDPVAVTITPHCRRQPEANVDTHGEQSAPLVCTIGHSNRPLEAFIDLLREHGISRVIDVRTVPRSRHNPHFGRDLLPASLDAAGISYTHMPGLGGLRRARPDSPNMGWRNVSFRGYADYMQTAGFQAEVARLTSMASQDKCALMCAEAVPWRCHRSLIADALLVRGLLVEHIIGPKARKKHTLTPFAQVAECCVSYPTEDQ